MAGYNAADVQAILAETNEQVNIFDGGAYHVERYHLPFALESPEDWLAWLLHDADLHEQMAGQEKSDVDRASYWEDAALMRTYAVALLLAGVHPADLEWTEHFAGTEGLEE